jgi:hypothetical protein
MDERPELSSWLHGKPLSFRALVLSIPWFVIAAFVLLEYPSHVEAVRVATQQGHFVCGSASFRPHPLDTIPLFVAGIGVALGQYWMIAVGFPFGLYAGLWALG